MFSINVTVTNGQILQWQADCLNDLIKAIYASSEGPDRILDPVEAIVITDMVEAKYGISEPGIFSWTEGIQCEE